ncbi:hypothetical protein ACQKD0_05085 [Vreelandella aquamarina]|uniref:hypothetical protein n=1 Tax=Vreelandella aquamarina TaxID=77097 RepID=UPI003CFD0191
MGLAAFNRLRRQKAENSTQHDQALAEEENGSDDIGALAAEYEERTGKKAGRMKAETIREKLDELNKDQE